MGYEPSHPLRCIQDLEQQPEVSKYDRSWNPDPSIPSLKILLRHPDAFHAAVPKFQINREGSGCRGLPQSFCRSYLLPQHQTPHLYGTLDAGDPTRPC